MCPSPSGRFLSASEEEATEPSTLQPGAGKSDSRRDSGRNLELILWTGLLLLCNWPGGLGQFADSLIFRPAAVLNGEWWRLLTYSWVHVTWYHLLLDGSAFLMLIRGLTEGSGIRRTFYVVAAASGSVLTAWWAAPGIGSTGLCGLSGVAHGLTAISALELMSDRASHPDSVRSGTVLFGAVVGKAAWEALTGKMFFTFLHFHRMGSPVAVSHAGGILGALVGWAAVRWLENESIRRKAPSS